MEAILRTLVSTGVRWVAAARVWNEVEDLTSFVKIPLRLQGKNRRSRHRETGWIGGGFCSKGSSSHSAFF